MSKVLFIFPPLLMDARFSHDVGDAGGNQPPLGLLIMSAILEKAGHKVGIVDAPVENLNLEDVLARVEKFGPDFVGVSGITQLAEKNTLLCRKLRERFPQVKLFIGGPHPTVMPEEVLAQTGVDLVITDEAETIIQDVIERFGEFEQKKIVHAGKVKDLDSLPLPARHLIDLKRYTALPNNYKRSPNAIHIITSRGCPYLCTFCFDAKTGFRRRSVEHVMAELRHVKEKYQAVEISFWDDLFTGDRKWVMDLCDRMIAENLDLVWSCVTRLNLVDAELLKKMKSAGCWNLLFGIESGNDELLKNINKLMTTKEMKEKVRLVQSIGIQIRGSFILGLPGETPAMGRKTIDYAIDLDVDYAHFSIATPYPGTELNKTADQWGTLTQEYSDYSLWIPVFVPKGYKDQAELKAVHAEAFRRFYLRPKFILRKLLSIRNPTDVARITRGFRLFLGFAN